MDDAREDWRFGNWRPEIERFVRHRETATVAQIAQRFRIPRTAAQSRIERMMREGTLERADRGLYRVKGAAPC